MDELAIGLLKNFPPCMVLAIALILRSGGSSRLRPELFKVRPFAQIEARLSTNQPRRIRRVLVTLRLHVIKPGKKGRRSSMRALLGVWCQPFTLLLVGAVVAGVSAQPAALSDSEVKAAIADSEGREFQSWFVEAAGRFGSGFSVVAQGPIGRTRDAAREAFEIYRPLKADELSMSTRARELGLIVIRHTDTHSSIRNVVIMPAGSRSRDTAIQPLVHRSVVGILVDVRDRLPRTWKPRLGTTAATFPQSFRFSEETLPLGDLTIVLATTEGDERYTIKQKDREKIR